MGIFYSFSKPQNTEPEFVTVQRTRRNFRNTSSAYWLSEDPGYQFSSIAAFVRQRVALDHNWVISNFDEFIANMNILNDFLNDSGVNASDDEDEYNDDEEGEGGKPSEFDRGIKPSDPRLVASREYLKSELAVRAGIFRGCCSVALSVGRRELGFLERPHIDKASSSKECKRCIHLTFSGFPPSKTAAIANRFFPNRRKIVDRLRTKTFCCCYTPSGQTLLTASQDEMIRIYERRGYGHRYYLREKIQSPFVGWSILDLIVSPDGRHCIYGTWSEKLYQCKLEVPENDISERWTVLNLNQDSDDDRFAFFSLRFNHDGSEIISGASDGRIYIYDREKGSSILSIVAHEDDVNAVCFGDTSGHLFFSAGDDGLCKVWDRRALLDGDRPVGAFAGHRDGVTFIDSKGDDRYLLTNAKDQTIKLWDIRCFSSLTAQDETKKSVTKQDWDYRYQPVPRKLYSHELLKGDGSVYTFRGGHSVLHTLIRAHFSPPYTGQRYIYTGCARGGCVVYDILSGGVACALNGHVAVVRDCIWHPFENEIVTTSWDGCTALWRFDERMERNINPDAVEDFEGDEESSDEFYRPIKSERRVVKRKAEDAWEYKRLGCPPNPG